MREKSASAGRPQRTHETGDSLLMPLHLRRERALTDARAGRGLKQAMFGFPELDICILFVPTIHAVYYNIE